MASSDSVAVFLKSSPELDLDLDFCFMVSSDDDISSLKKKAEAEHLLSFPEKGRIVAQAIKIMQEGVMYHVSNSMPIACLIDGPSGTCSLFMDAVTLPPNPAETHVLDQHESSMPGSKILSQGTASVVPREEEAEDKLVQGEQHISSEKNSQGEFAGFLVHNPGDTSGVRYPIEGSPNQGGNTSCTSQAPERRSLQGSESKDSVVEEVTQGVGIFGEYVEDKGKQKNSKYPSSDEAPSSNKRGSPKSGDKMRESGGASENKTVGVHHKRGSSLSELETKGMPGCMARSLEHFTEQFAFGPSDKGKAKLDQSHSSSRTRSPNCKTLKMQKHGVTIREPCPDSREIIIVESLGGEERDRGLSCEKCCSIEESGLENKELEDQIARLNQIKCDELMSRFLQEEIIQELPTSDEEMLDGIDVVTENLQEDEDYHDANCPDNEPSASHHHQLNEAKENRRRTGREGLKRRVMELRKALGVEMEGGDNLNLSEKERHERAVIALFEFFGCKGRARGVNVQAQNRTGTGTGALGPTGAVTKAQRQRKPPPEAAAAAAAASSVAVPQAKPATKIKCRSQLKVSEKRSEAYMRVPRDFS